MDSIENFYSNNHVVPHTCCNVLENKFYLTLDNLEILLVKKVFSKTLFSMFFEELPKIQSILN